MLGIPTIILDYVRFHYDLMPLSSFFISSLLLYFFQAIWYYWNIRFRAVALVQSFLILSVQCSIVICVHESEKPSVFFMNNVFLSAFLVPLHLQKMTPFLSITNKYSHKFFQVCLFLASHFTGAGACLLYSHSASTWVVITSVFYYL